jgi:hypothetical protein
MHGHGDLHKLKDPDTSATTFAICIAIGFRILVRIHVGSTGIYIFVNLNLN